MIVQEFYLEKYNWSIKVYYAVDTHYVDDILADLMELNPSIREFEKAKGIVTGENKDSGFTFTNYDLMRSLVFIGLTSSPEEFQNTFDHEKGHLISHIGQYYNIDPYGESYQYLAGDIGKKLFPIAKKFICKHCRESLKTEVRKFSK